MKNVFRKLNPFYSIDFNISDMVTSYFWNMLSSSEQSYRFLSSYIFKLLLPLSSISSVIGFSLVINIATQIFSGFFLAWYYIPEPGLVIELREEMFIDTRFGLEIFNLHVKGVDSIFVLSYAHILKKVFLKNFISPESDGWILGGYAFFWFHYIVVLGISLSGNHLSDLTLTIAANIFWSLFNNVHKSYYIIFTNKHLNTDQLSRLMVLHYITPFYYLYLIQLHVMFCHESWDSDSVESTIEDRSTPLVSWSYDAIPKELQDAYVIFLFIIIYWFFHTYDLTTVGYYFFERWNISELDEIRFYGVAPHWYFKPLMGILVISPTHYEGLMWIGLFFIGLAFLPVINAWYNTGISYYPIRPMQSSKLQSFLFFLFILSLICVASILPCGRYYYEPEGGYSGNTAIKFSLQYIYSYLFFILHYIDIIEHYSMLSTNWLSRSKGLNFVHITKAVLKLGTYYRHYYEFEPVIKVHVYQETYPIIRPVYKVFV